MKKTLGCLGLSAILIVMLMFLIGFTIEAATQSNISEAEFFNLLKARKELVKSGKISFDVLTYAWKNENDYKAFAEKLQGFAFTEPQKFREWFLGEKNNSLINAEKRGYVNKVYFFDGQKDHLIADFPLRTDLPKNVKQNTHYEYSCDGTVVREYSDMLEGMLMNIYPKQQKRGYCDISLFDLTLANIWGGLETTGQKRGNYTFSVENGKCYIVSAPEKSIFDLTTSSGGMLYLHVDWGDGLYSKEIISGAFSKVNNTIYLPYFTCITEFSYDAEKKLKSSETTMYLVKSWELRPVSQEELTIHPLPSTQVSDFTGK